MVSVAVASVVVLGFTYINFHNIRISESNVHQLQANLYAMEAMEVTKDLAISAWDEFDECGSVCHPQLDTNEGKWRLVSGPEEDLGPNGVFTRTMEVGDVYRDGNNNIVTPSAGGDLDTHTKRVSVTVNWEDAVGEQEVDVETYVHIYDTTN